MNVSAYLRPFHWLVGLWLLLSAAISRFLCFAKEFQVFSVRFFRFPLSALTLCLCASVVQPLRAQTNMVTPTWEFSDVIGHGSGVQSVTITPISTAAASPFFALQRPIRVTRAMYPTLTNGTFTTNVYVGVNLLFQVTDSYGTYGTNYYFPTNLSGAVSAAAYAAISTNLPNGALAYSMAQSDARYPTFATTTNIALQIAQSVAATNTGGGGSGGVTNAGGVLAGMLTNANFSADGTNAIQGIVRSQTNFNSTFVILGDAGTGTEGNVLLEGRTTQDRSNVVYAIYYDVQDGDSGSYGYGKSVNWTVVSDGFVNNESASGTGGGGIQGYLFDVRSLYSTNSDARWAVGSAAGYGPNLKFGSKIETFPLRDMTYSTTANAGQFFYSYMQDGRGGLSFGDNPSLEHLLDWKSVPWVRIRGSSDNTRPQFQLEGTGKPFIGTVTNGAFFNDGTNVSLVQNGQLGAIAISGGTFTGNGLGLTNIQGSGIAGLPATNQIAIKSETQPASATLTNLAAGIGVPVYYRLTTNYINTNAFPNSPFALTFSTNGTYLFHQELYAIGQNSTNYPAFYWLPTNSVAAGFYTYRAQTQRQMDGGFNTSQIETTAFQNIPISTANSIAGTAVMLYARSYNGAGQQFWGTIDSTLIVTNAPVTLTLTIASAGGGGTSTNRTTIYRNSWWSLTRIE